MMLGIILAGCIPEDETGGSTTVGIASPPRGESPDVPVLDGATSGDNAFPWNRYFVTEFSQPEVQRIRNLPGYLANGFRFNLRIADHPDYQGFGRQVQSHPLAAARLDYALSTGLTGAGQIVSLIDDGVRLSHEQFAGKTIHRSGAAPTQGDFHGTAVASVMAGTGADGGTLGFAPGADVHLGYLDYDAPVSWTALGGHMRSAAALGAIVSNNSWGLSDRTVGNTNMADFTRGARTYVDGLRTFAPGGVVVFALQNDHDATSASLMAGLPLALPDLEANWISVINAVPTFDDDRIISAARISTACLETARFCMTANGQIKVATQASDNSYQIGVGASFAAPQVAGSIALLAEAFPDLSAAQLRDRLLVTADNGFFAHEGVVTFAPGITHGYNAEFGHGFLDLRSALLPIGRAVLPLANGQTLDLARATITTGTASGDALARALADVSIVTTDQLHGSFTVSGAVLVAPAERADPAAMALQTALAGAPADATMPWGVGDVADLLESDRFPLTAQESPLDAAVIAGNGTVGLSLQRRFAVAGGQAQLGMTSLQTQGSILGMGAGQGEARSITTALQADVAAPLAIDTLLHVTAEMGVATGEGAGLMRDVGTLAYDRLGIALARSDLAARGDSLTLFARRPIAITQGAARIDLPMAMAGGGIGFAAHDLNLAPADRQVDLGLAYRRPASDDGTFSIGVMHSWHDGNVADRDRLSAFVGLQFQR